MSAQLRRRKVRRQVEAISVGYHHRRGLFVKIIRRDPEDHNLSARRVRAFNQFGRPSFRRVLIQLLALEKRERATQTTKSNGERT